MGIMMKKRKRKSFVRKGKKGYCFRGSVTVEASCLMPLIIFLIWNILFLSFFVYDQTVMMQGSYCTALRTQRLINEEAEKLEEGEKKFEDAVEERVVCGRLEHQISVEKEAVSVKTTLKMNAPAGLCFQSVWQGCQEQRVDKWEPVNFIRACRKAENILEFLKTGNVETEE